MPRPRSFRGQIRTAPGDFYSGPPHQWKPTETPSQRERHLAEVLEIILDAARPTGAHLYDIVLTIDDLTHDDWKRLAEG
jgi:hypothetical protein